MHICVIALVKSPKHVDHRARLLRRRSAIEINQRMTVCSLAQDREILADGVPIDGASSDLVHTIICYTRRRAPLYSSAVAGCETRRTRFAQRWRRQVMAINLNQLARN